jgi:integrase/recombinase XerD
MKLYPDATRAFIDDSASSLRSANTRRTYRLYLELLQRAHPYKRVGQFIEHDLVTFCSGEGLAPGTVRQRRKIVCQFFEWATWRGHCRTNPAVGLKRIVRPPNRGVRSHRWLTGEEIHAVLDACRDGELLGQRDEVLLTLGFMTGLRVHEITNLCWPDISMSQRTISIIGKGEKPATIGINVQLAEPLKRWKELAEGPHVVPAMHSQWISEQKGGAPVAIDWTRGLGRQGIAAVIRKRAELAGVERCAPHDMRRSYAGLLESKGVPIQDISKALRHSDIATTQRYLEDNPARVVDFMRGFEI